MNYNVIVIINYEVDRESPRSSVVRVCQEATNRKGYYSYKFNKTVSVMDEGYV